LDLEACAIDGEFDVVFNSSLLRVAKPDVEAFTTVADLLGVPIERCLFIDDTVPNVEGAQRAGMHAETFTGVAELRALLERAQLLDRSSAP
jgi:putative hydrolase of the HAD superfamily